MTEEQLAVARAHQAYHRDAFDLPEVNTAFHHGFIEQLEALGLEPASFDVIVSNCVINLAEDKAAVLRGVFDLLKPGGEMYFSDVYASRRMPAALVEDDVLYGECLSGALYWNDFLALSKSVGFGDPRVVEHRPLTIDNPLLQAKVDPISFASVTCRLFKLPGLEPNCEDYGQAVIYKGTVEHSQKAFRLDGTHKFEAGRIYPVCGNTWRMLADTRFAPHFEVLGSFSNHFGAFDGCAPTDVFAGEALSGPTCC